MKYFEDEWRDKAGITFFFQGWEPNEAKPKAFIAFAHGLGEHTHVLLRLAKQ